MLSKKIRRLRDEAGVSQGELAEQLQIGVSTLRLYETGQRTPPADVLVRICRRFSVSADYLLDLSDAEGPQPVNVPDELRADASVFMKAAADLCELESSRPFDRSVLPIYKTIAQALRDLVAGSDARLSALISSFPEYAGTRRPGELPEDLRLEVLAQVAAGSVDPELQKAVRAGKEYADDVQALILSASLKIGAMVQHALKDELVVSRDSSIAIPPAPQK